MGKYRLKDKYRKLFRNATIGIIVSILAICILPNVVKRFATQKTIKGSTMLDYPFTHNPVYGIDVSVHQGDIDWSEVSRNAEKPISFVYIKASEGATLKDRRYKYNLSAAREHGILVGSYHYFKANRTAESQWANFSALADKDTQDLTPLIDVEEMNGASKEVFLERLSRFVSLVENHYGKKPIIYSQNHFFNSHLAEKYENYPVMIARYHVEQPTIEKNSGWTIWQFTEKGSVAGINGFVDVNILNNVEFDLDELKM
jgi:lysozyme